MSKELDEYVRKFMQDPENPQVVKDQINILFTSHLTLAQEFERKGMFEEAIAEYAKEYDRPIKNGIDAEIMQKAYFQTGEVYRKLGKINEALIYMQKARELLIKYGVGSGPHKDLAEIYMEQGKIDEAIEVYEEYVQKWPENNFMKQLLLKAREKRDEA